jgi:Leucine-rich repeat (LRR) protein
MKLKSLTKLDLPMLKKLILSENEITTCEEFGGHSTLEFLDLGKNKLKDLKGVENMPKLKELILSENEVTSP